MYVCGMNEGVNNWTKSLFDDLENAICPVSSADSFPSGAGTPREMPPFL